MNLRLKAYKQQWKEHLERMSDSKLSNHVWKCKPIRHRCVCVDPGRDDWKIFEDGTGSTLHMPWCEGDELAIYNHVFVKWQHTVIANKMWNIKYNYHYCVYSLCRPQMSKFIFIL